MRGALYQEPPQGILGHTFGGIPMRHPYPSEAEFFKSSNVPAYAAEDNAVVFNPYANLDPAARRSLEMNEAARIWMRQNNLRPNFAINPQQAEMLRGTHYAAAPIQDQLETIASRLLSGDPSAGQPTPEQEAFIKRLRFSMGIR